MADRLITIKLTQEKLTRLRKLFAEEDEARLVEKAVDECLDEHPSETKPGSSLLKMIGMFKGERDMSTRHDEFVVPILHIPGVRP
ncbi:MAG: hypothetical protein ABFD94_07300 [Armatimonadia bacterium]